MRTLSGDVQTALAQPHFQFIDFIELDFSGGFVRVCTSYVDVSWSGQTWTGAGAILGIGAIEESGDVQARSVTISLRGALSDLISIALAQEYQGRSAKIWRAVLNDAGTVLGSALMYVGRMDVMPIQDGDTCTIAVTAESRLADLKRPRIARYNDADQQSRYSGDVGLQYVDALAADTTLRWGEV